MRSNQVVFGLSAFCVICVVLCCRVEPSWGDGFRPTPVDTKRIPRTPQESATLWDFFKDRTHLAYAFDENYNDNLLLSKNDGKREEFTSTVEGNVFFVDPRGSLLYGGDYEFNAFKLHRLNLSAIDHDGRFFFDLQPGGRTQYRFDYLFKIRNALLFGPTDVDIFRRSSKLERQLTHEWIGKIRYALNNTNAAVPQIDYLIFDDRSVNSADTSRRELKTVLDLDHDWIPGWTLFGGYEFDDIRIPGDKKKNSQSHGARWGVRYELSELSKLDLLIKYDVRAFETGQSRGSFGLKGTWKYQLGPRTEFTFAYKDERTPSYQSDRLQFRNLGPSLDISYELTPLVKITSGANYEKHRSDTQDIVAGISGTTPRFSQYRFLAGIHYRIREKTHVDLNYVFSRSRTNDYVNNVVELDFESEF